MPGPSDTQTPVAGDLAWQRSPFCGEAEPDALPSEQVLPTALALAERVCSSAPLSTRFSKELGLRSEGLSLHDAMALQTDADPMNSDDRREGVDAFVEKRRPEWRNR